MVIFILENVKISIRGELSRWLLEIKSGVFAGKLSALVRDELWQFIIEKIGNGSALMIYSSNNEQGFNIKLLGNMIKSFEDIDGIFLVKSQLK